MLVLLQVIGRYAMLFCETAARMKEESLVFALGQVLILYELSVSSTLAASLIKFHIPTHCEEEREKEESI